MNWPLSVMLFFGILSSLSGRSKGKKGLLPSQMRRYQSRCMLKHLLCRLLLCCQASDRRESPSGSIAGSRLQSKREEYEAYCQEFRLDFLLLQLISTWVASILALRFFLKDRYDRAWIDNWNCAFNFQSA